MIGLKSSVAGGTGQRHHDCFHRWPEPSSRPSPASLSPKGLNCLDNFLINLLRQLFVWHPAVDLSERFAGPQRNPPPKHFLDRFGGQKTSRFDDPLHGHTHIAPGFIAENDPARGLGPPHHQLPWGRRDLRE
jgi:hypothetical protein